MDIELALREHIHSLNERIDAQNSAVLRFNKETNEMSRRAIHAEDKVRELQNLLIEAFDDYVKVGYGASHEDVEAFKEFRSRCHKALDVAAMKAHCPSCFQAFGSESEAVFQSDRALRLAQRIDVLRNALADIEADNCGACDTESAAKRALELDEKLAAIGG